MRFSCCVFQAMLHAWQGYKNGAWGHDELLPVSRTALDSFGMGLTIIDSLDTLWLMGCVKHFILRLLNQLPNMPGVMW